MQRAADRGGGTCAVYMLLQQVCGRDGSAVRAILTGLPTSVVLTRAGLKTACPETPAVRKQHIHSQCQYESESQGQHTAPDCNVIHRRSLLESNQLPAAPRTVRSRSRLQSTVGPDRPPRRNGCAGNAAAAAAVLSWVQLARLRMRCCPKHPRGATTRGRGPRRASRAGDPDAYRGCNKKYSPLRPPRSRAGRGSLGGRLDKFRTGVTTLRRHGCSRGCDFVG